MRMLPRAFVLSAALLLSAVASANQHGVERVRFLHYGIDDGLSQATARAMVQDDAGFMWIATQDGLDRFDSHEFHVFRHDPSSATTIGDNVIFSLARGHTGELWIGTQSGGVSRYDALNGTFTRFQRDPHRAESLAGNPVTALLFDSRKRLWVASGGGNLQWLEPARGTFRVIPGSDSAK